MVERSWLTSTLIPLADTDDQHTSPAARRLRDIRDGRDATSGYCRSPIGALVRQRS